MLEYLFRAIDEPGAYRLSFFILSSKDKVENMVF